MSLACLRSLFSLALLVALLVLGATFYLEFALGLASCPLCLSQRIFLATFAIVCLLALLHRPGPLLTRAYAGLALVLALAGALLAWRQIWLQGHASAADLACPYPLRDWLEHSSPLELFQALLLGSRECVALSWSFLDLSAPEWSLLTFLLLALLALSELLGALRQPRH